MIKKVFTLIELLVVVAIIALLTGILVPTVSKAREAARRAACLANLRSIGQAIRSYMADNHDFYPPMAKMPSIEAELHPSNPRLPMSHHDLLGQYVGDQKKVFKCPSDRIIDPSDEKPEHGETTWFEWQGSSYEPRTGLSIVNDDGYWEVSRENANITPDKSEYLEDILGSIAKIVLIHDYENFHGKEEAPNSIMALYADFHAGALDEVEENQ